MKNSLFHHDLDRFPHLSSLPVQMYGRYTKDLGEYARDEAKRLKDLDRQRKKDDKIREKVKINFSNFLPSHGI